MLQAQGTKPSSVMLTPDVLFIQPHFYSRMAASWTQLGRHAPPTYTTYTARQTDNINNTSPTQEKTIFSGHISFNYLARTC
jgi:hypothetical protein